jgi:hypothetical protein
MPRPFKTGLDYFPLDTNFFENKKIKNLRRAHGPIGVLTYLNLLCRVYQNGYFYKFEDADELAMDIAEQIASEQIRRTATCVTETINYLVGRGILDEGLFKQSIISGVALQEQYVISAYKAKRKINLDVHSLVDANVVIAKFKDNSEETAVNSEETEVNAEFGAQSKVNNSKTNNNIFTTTTDTRAPASWEVLEYFDELRSGDNGSEAFEFMSYNNERGWDCLPDWKSAAKKWIKRIK